MLRAPTTYFGSIDANEVIEAIKGTEPRQIALAALFVAAVIHLTFYDHHFCRARDRSLAVSPTRQRARRLHLLFDPDTNVGANVFTGGAVALSGSYSTWGLNAIDVAKICFLAGLTFWLGNAAGAQGSASLGIRKPPLPFDQPASL